MAMWWHNLLDRPQALAAASPFETKLVIALRLAVVAHKSGTDPAPHIASRLGCLRITHQFSLVVEAMGQAWPEPFGVSRPCCAGLSPDEALFTGLMRAARRGNRAAFDRLSCEMLGEDARTLIYNLMWQFGKMVGADSDASPGRRPFG